MPLQARRLVADASAALARRQASAAEKFLRQALALTPGHPEIQRLLGMALRLQNHNQEALALLREAVVRRPDDALIQNGLGSTLDACGDPQGAIAAFRRACELAPNAPQLWSNLGKTLGDRGRFEEALPVLEHAAGMSDHSATHLRLAYALRAVGRIDESMQRFRDMIERNPSDGTAWLGLAGMKTRRLSRDDISAITAVLQTPDLKDENRISLEFTLAKAYEDNDMYAEAFAMYTDANAKTRQIHSWDAKLFSRIVDDVLRIYDKPIVVNPESRGEQVIFIVSLPRSGSSLTEQILASHPQVQGAGELGETTAVIIAESERRKQPFPLWVPQSVQADWQRLGEEYLRRTADWQRPGMRFTDKLPGNWLRVGALMAMLPGARIIDSRRDPLESCLSCFRTLFSDGDQPFSYDLADIASYWHDYERASRHWQQIFPKRYRLQSYEALVENPEQQIRELLDFCDLPFDPVCLRFHETRRSVRTASASQIREPIRRDTARADKYGALLDPLREALGLTNFGDGG